MGLFHPLLRSWFSCIAKQLQVFSVLFAQGFDEHQFARAVERSVHHPIEHNVAGLFFAEEGQLPQIFHRCLVQIEGVRMDLFQQFIHILVLLAVVNVLFQYLLNEIFPRNGTLCTENQRESPCNRCNGNPFKYEHTGMVLFFFCKNSGNISNGKQFMRRFCVFCSENPFFLWEAFFILLRENM